MRSDVVIRSAGGVGGLELSHLHELVIGVVVVVVVKQLSLGVFEHA